MVPSWPWNGLRRPTGVKLALERYFCRPGSAKLALERRFAALARRQDLLHPTRPGEPGSAPGSPAASSQLLRRPASSWRAPARVRLPSFRRLPLPAAAASRHLVPRRRLLRVPPRRLLPAPPLRLPLRRGGGCHAGTPPAGSLPSAPAAGPGPGRARAGAACRSREGRERVEPRARRARAREARPRRSMAFWSRARAGPESAGPLRRRPRADDGRRAAGVVRAGRSSRAPRGP